MHDKHGRAIAEGDVVVGNSWAHGNKPRAMKVVGCNEGTETCNLICISFEAQIPSITVTAKESVLILKADGTIVPQPN